MKAILTTVIPATNTQPRRIKAYDCDRNQVVMTEDSCSEDAHKNAAKKLCDKMGWTGELVSGWTGNGYAHCFKNQ